MTVGKDVSALFPDVANCMQTDNLELKKLVYLYLVSSNNFDRCELQWGSEHSNNGTILVNELLKVCYLSHQTYKLRVRLQYEILK